MREAINLNVYQLLDVCRARQIRLRTAESCTAGAIAALIASVPGASDVLDRGWVVYSNQAKQEELGVDERLIQTYGAVSQQVVEAMALGGATEQAACVAVSGIAGPSGGSPDKPVGTVWIAVARGKAISNCRCCHFVGDRPQVQLATVLAAVEMLLESVSS
ncbi:MAG: hypothetical protein CO186_09345 [Zetaproteobacteria bacterium CG_4_9_14_3_um_filter_49_83]|nr:MAG: hypothetical protein AUJ56_12815 [Zetaproteobacteria bacterium CG1_02_49_23]PIQ30887.1 MAG: hypothetical protein COW62_10930 [Zetaproteobacteria bacterium CG17_big_fil_post_rev_8_21_14_2_50_50_13]PIV30528.1 MAG: hypothetical protein COS35_06270 [Zetaproteobacteria bacterium CG02_land_8_20_14_3_00_50_9]PIY56206.1 MAG: hypothetical protein COZ00_05195 [Zetaproteobacteria bacterium CG_4_10_14_0_8_um_filter_49_80]PJA34689.1 MAG: hypothetical protein CO186_09345 [Zetaproteobacteria bacterium